MIGEALLTSMPRTGINSTGQATLSISQIAIMRKLSHSAHAHEPGLV